MGIPVLVLGESGTGKSASMRNLPENTVIIQAVSKPLPFRSSFKRRTHDNPSGSIAVTDDWQRIIKTMQSAANAGRKIIVIDDFQYVMANEFMRRTQEKGFDKFTEIASHAWQVIMTAQSLPDDVIVYFLSHVQTGDNGVTKAKTIGKMLDEKITVEGLFTIVLRTHVEDGKYSFSTQNNGSDTVKSPMGLFDQQYIDNDLNAVTEAVNSYWS